MGKSYNAKALAGQGKNDARNNHILAIIEKYTPLNKSAVRVHVTVKCLSCYIFMIYVCHKYEVIGRKTMVSRLYAYGLVHVKTENKVINYVKN